MRRHFTVTVFIGLAISLGYMSTDIYLPSMPAMAHYFSQSQDLIQLSIPPHFLGSAIAGLIGGSLSDRVGRKKILLWGLTALGLASLAAAFSPTIYFLMLCRLLQGVGVGMVTVAGITAVHELYPAEHSTHALAGLGMSFAIAPAVAPILGGYIELALGWQANFLVVAILSFCAYWGIAQFLKDTPTSQSSGLSSFKKSFATYWAMMKSRAYLRYSLITPGLYAGEICFLTVLPIHFISILHVPVEFFGYYIAFTVSCYFFASLMTPHLTKLLGADKLIKMALTLAMIGAFLQVLAVWVLPGRPLIIMSLLCLNEIADAFAFGPSITRLLEEFPSAKGAATALRNTLISLAAACGGFAGGIFDDSSTLPMGIFMLAIPLLVYLVAFGLPFASRISLRRLVT